MQTKNGIGNILEEVLKTLTQLPTRFHSFFFSLHFLFRCRIFELMNLCMFFFEARFLPTKKLMKRNLCCVSHTYSIFSCANFSFWLTEDVRLWRFCRSENQQFLFDLFGVRLSFSLSNYVDVLTIWRTFFSQISRESKQMVRIVVCIAIKIYFQYTARDSSNIRKKEINESATFPFQSTVKWQRYFISGDRMHEIKQNKNQLRHSDFVPRIVLFLRSAMGWMNRWIR